MRHFFICTLFSVVALPAIAQTKDSDWATRVMANDPKVRGSAEAALVQGTRRSLPLLRRFLNRRNEVLHKQTFEIIQRIGPPAIPLLVELLRDDRTSIRLAALNELIDLAPDTQWIQPALRRALRDEDSMVAGDAARALGALGPKASPSVRALVATLSLGGPRRFLLRPSGGGRSLALSLGSGDLLVMGGSCQRTWQHSIPKVKQAEPRISVMFRPVWRDA